jgi:hypothetical protein
MRVTPNRSRGAVILQLKDHDIEMIIGAFATVDLVFIQIVRVPNLPEPPHERSAIERPMVRDSSARHPPAGVRSG